MPIPLFEGKPFEIVELVQRYKRQLNDTKIRNEDKISFNKIRKKIMKDLLSPIIGIGEKIQDNPKWKWEYGKSKRTALIETLKWCQKELNLTDSAIERWTNQILRGREIRRNKLKNKEITTKKFKDNRLSKN